MTSFMELVGKVNNLNDPRPALNQKPVMLGIVISFLVGSSFLALSTFMWCCLRTSSNMKYADTSTAMCWPASMDPHIYCSGGRMG